MSHEAIFDGKRYYHIFPVTVGDNALTGVGPVLPTFQHVHIDAAINKWHLDSQAELGVFRLSLKDSYPFTGVDAEGNVIATDDKEKDREWKIRYWNSIQGFSIDFNDDLRPSRTWSLSSDRPDAKIMIRTYESVPDRSQVFKIVKVHE